MFSYKCLLINPRVRLILVLLLFGLLSLACASLPPAVSQATPTSALTSTPTLEPTATPTPKPTITPTPTPAPLKLISFAEKDGNVFRLEIPEPFTKSNLLSDQRGFYYGFSDEAETHFLFVGFEQVDEAWEKTVQRFAQGQTEILEDGVEVNRQVETQGDEDFATLEYKSESKKLYQAVWLYREKNVLVVKVAVTPLDDWPAWQAALEQSAQSLKWDSLKISNLIAVPSLAQPFIKAHQLTPAAENIENCNCLGGRKGWMLYPESDVDLFTLFSMTAFFFGDHGYLTVGMLGGAKAAGEYQVWGDYLLWTLQDNYPGSQVDLTGTSFFKTFLFTNPDGSKYLYLYNYANHTGKWLGKMDE